MINERASPFLSLPSASVVGATLPSVDVCTANVGRVCVRVSNALNSEARMRAQELRDNIGNIRGQRRSLSSDQQGRSVQAARGAMLRSCCMLDSRAVWEWLYQAWKNVPFLPCALPIGGNAALLDSRLQIVTLRPFENGPPYVVWAPSLSNFPLKKLCKLLR